MSEACCLEAVTAVKPSPASSSWWPGDNTAECVCVCIYIYIWFYDCRYQIHLIMLCRNKQECSCWNFLVLFCCKVRFRWVITIKTEFLSLYLHKVYFTFLSINVNFQWSHMDDIRYFKDLAHFAIRICLYRTDFFDCWSFFFFLID